MILPPILETGDSIAVVATANKVDRQHLRPGIDLVKSWGLKVHEGDHLYASDHQFAGTDKARAADLQTAIDDKDIKAILLARGGYGTTRIIDRLDFSPLLENPKWVCGFSDVTALLFHLNKMGIAAIHSSMPVLFQRELSGESDERLKALLFGEFAPIEIGNQPENRFGQAKGEIIGGNLSIICHLIGTPSDVSFKNKILMLEDVGEYLYNLDRMMVQLKRSGKLGQLAGLVVGQFTKVQDNGEPFGKTAYQIIREHIDDYDFPAAFGFPIGHTEVNFPLPIGVQSEFVVDEKSGAWLDCQL